MKSDDSNNSGEKALIQQKLIKKMTWNLLSMCKKILNADDNNDYDDGDDERLKYFMLLKAQRYWHPVS